MPYRSVLVKPPVFMTYKGTKVYHIFRRDDADSGVLRSYFYTFDPVNGSDDEIDGKVTFDVRDLSTWFPSKVFLEEKAVKKSIREAIIKGEIGIA